MFKNLCFTTVAVFAAHAALADDVLPSADSTFTKYGEESGWTIFVDDTKHSCLIERVDENTNVVQMGLTKDAKFGYLGIFSQTAALKDRTEPILLSLDGHEYTAEAKMKTKNLADGYVGGYFLADNQQFVDDVMNKMEMTVYPKDDYAFKVSLEGTKAAIEAAMKCNAEQTM